MFYGSMKMLYSKATGRLGELLKCDQKQLQALVFKFPNLELQQKFELDHAIPHSLKNKT